MPEHSPSPTPERAIYGFVLYLLAIVAFCMYLIWAWTPDHYLHLAGFTYLPQKYWAVVIPAFCCVAVVLSYPVYLGFTFLNAPPLTSLQVLTDRYTIESSDKDIPEDAIPPLADISISEVNRRLYLK